VWRKGVDDVEQWKGWREWVEKMWTRTGEDVEKGWRKKGGEDLEKMCRKDKKNGE